MPNHETNHVVIVGSEEKLRRILDEVIKPVPKGDRPGFAGDPIHFFDFSDIVPPPENIETGDCNMRNIVNGVHQDTGEVCWYQWNVDNWGTKWSAYDLDYEGIVEQPYSEGHLLYIVFQTAWSAPTPIFEALETKYEVQVHAWTEDEGGYPPQVFGEPERFLDVTATHYVYDEDAEDDRVATEAEVAADEAYARWEVELR